MQASNRNKLGFRVVKGAMPREEGVGKKPLTEKQPRSETPDQVCLASRAAVGSGTVSNELRVVLFLCLAFFFVNRAFFSFSPVE